jgi:D-beta-D-heptose 7-phosphate kinase/D-beta-D-heptose 1-phosphate adenosyltransferase
MDEPIRIWVNGCFDVLHVGHIRLMQYARSLGDHLTVGIDTDERVRKAKGEDRPFNNQNIRAEILMSMSCVDDVVTFDSNEGLENAIRSYGPDLIVVGDDYRFKDVVGEKHSQGVAFFSHIEGQSTTKILNYNKGDDNAEVG